MRPEELAGRIAIAIDVIRATTTISVALAAGCAAILPVASVGEAQARANALTRDNVLLAGERGGLRLPGFDLGNSPLEYTPESVATKRVIFTTSNGTRTLTALAGAQDLLVASFLNVEAVCRWVIRRGLDVLIACAGESGSPAAEDTACGGLIVDRLHSLSGQDALLDDAAQEAQGASRAALVDLPRFLKSTNSGRHITALGLGADLEVCAQVNALDLVPYRVADALVACPRAV